MSKDTKTIGPYQVRELLGEGWRASVYRAERPDQPEEVALKLYVRELGDRRRLRKWIKELKQLQQQQPSGTEVILDLGELDGAPYVARRLDPTSRPLTDLLAEAGGALPARRAVELTMLVAEALYRLHNTGCYHRNLKPENVLVRNMEGGPEVELVDVGLPVRVLFQDADDAFAKGADPAFTAPELFNDEEAADARVDVWAAGALLWRLIAGEAPFAADSFSASMARIQSGNPGPLPQGTHSDIAAFCHKCLQLDPHHRYRSCLLLAQDLRRHLEHKPIDARRVPVSERVSLLVRRVWPQALAIVGIILAVLCILTLFSILASS